MPVASQSFAPHRAACVVFFTVLGIALSFAVYTRHAWEDYYITYRCSKNLATGQGLVFTPGERVHAFTSPLNTLIPAALSYATGNVSDRLVFWLFRIFSAGALAAAAVLLYQIARSQSFGPLATFTLLGLFATLPGIVDFSINGQETGLMMFFLALALHSLTVPGGRPTLRLAIAWAGLLWTRPDAFVYIAAIAATFLLFNAGSSALRTRIGLAKTYLVAGAGATALYLPWLAWAWCYFGSPVPHTIVAKGLHHSLGLPDLWEKSVASLGQLFSCKALLLDLIFAPPYAIFGGWPAWVPAGCRLLAWTAAFYWLLPFGQRQTRAVSLAFLVALWYLSVVAPGACPWYLPNAAILGVYVLGHLVQQSADVLRLFAELKPGGEYLLRARDWASSRARLLHRAAAVAIPAFSAAMLVLSAFQLRIQQREIERGNRMQIGLWLRANAKSPDDSVFLEPLGYIGYYSQLKMLDWPGLCSPEVVAFRKKSQDWAKLLAELRPDWLVLRPHEIAAIRSADPKTLGERYSSVKIFDVSGRLQAYRWIPGLYYLTFDQTFTIYRRSDPKVPDQRLASQGSIPLR